MILPVKVMFGAVPVVNVLCDQPDVGGVNTYVPTGEGALYMMSSTREEPDSGKNSKMSTGRSNR